MHLSEISKDELEQAGYTPQSARKLLFTLLLDSDAIVILERATPIAILIIQTTAEDICETYFVGTEAFFTGARPTLHLRKLVDKRLATKHRHMKLVSISFSAHPELLRWYKLMGYELGEQKGRYHKFVRLAARPEPGNKAA